jgi:hypothetical protein
MNILTVMVADCGMMRVSFLHAARVFMAMRECLVPDKRKEAQEEIVADLNTCLEQLIQRSTEMEAKIAVCMERAVCHMQSSKREPTASGKTRERARAKMYMEDKRRIQMEYDKAQRSIHMLQQQIDSIVSSHTDMVIVDTMRQFNATAARLSLPNKVMEIENLGEELAERQHEVANFQEAMQGVSTACLPPSSMTGDEPSDDLLMQELEEYMMEGCAQNSNAINNKEDNDEISLMARQIPPVPIPTSTPISRNMATATSVPPMQSNMPQPRFVLCEDDDREDVSGMPDSAPLEIPKRQREVSQALFF